MKVKSALSHFLVLVVLVLIRPPDVALADGCFVFKWDKKIDINEPTQKAIIVHDAGREEMLLQVKYEGPLEEFGWLIPTPSLPKVEKGSMEPFYELSQLTQKRFGTPQAHATRGMLNAAGEGHEAVKVIEIKTVGAYEVAVLSAQESGSLARWLQEHDYSLPEGKSEIIDEYVRRGWYFIAAKIELNKGVDLKRVASGGSKNVQSRTSARKMIQLKLSSGELHPLLISFDTAKPVFPLKISAVGDKPSEVSLYVISKEALLERTIFDKAIGRAKEEFAKWEAGRPEQRSKRDRMRGTRGAMSIRFFLDSFYTTNRPPVEPGLHRDYSQQDLERIATEGKPAMATEILGETFYSSPEEMLPCMSLAAEKIPKSSGSFLRLKTGGWYLTKIVQTFAPADMHDLEFEAAIPVLAAALSQNIGGTPAQLLARLGHEGETVLRRACKSSNPTERLNAVVGFEGGRTKGITAEVADLLRDNTPAVRLHALRAADAEPNPSFIDPVVALLRDPAHEVRVEASGYLSNHEHANRTQVYLELMKDSDSDVRAAALGIATWVNRFSPSDEVFVAARGLLKDSDEQVQEAALYALHRMNREEVPRKEILPFLSNPRAGVSAVAFGLLRRGVGPGPIDYNGILSSEEAALLVTNRLTMSRLTGLKVLEANGDAHAVELILPLLTDTNTIVRNRAFVVLRRITKENIPDDAEKWQAWWRVNKSTFAASKTPR